MAYENSLIRERADLADSKERVREAGQDRRRLVQKVSPPRSSRMEKKNKQTGGIGRASSAGTLWFLSGELLRMAAPFVLLVPVTIDATMNQGAPESVSLPNPLTISPPADPVAQLYLELEANVREYRPKDDLSGLEKAFRFASKYHEGQTPIR